MITSGLAGELERKLTQVWESIEARRWAPAQRLLQPLLVKYPNSDVVTAFNALCLHCTGHHGAAARAVRGLLAQPPQDTRALQAVRVVLQSSDDWPALAALAKAVYERSGDVADGEEYFFSLLRAQRFGALPAVALQLYRQSKASRHRQWHPAALYLQATVPAPPRAPNGPLSTATPNGPPSPVEGALHGKLCVGALERALQDGANCELFLLLLEAKQASGEHRDVARLLLSELGEKSTPESSKEMRFLQAAQSLITGSHYSDAYALLHFLVHELQFENNSTFRYLIEANNNLCSESEVTECHISIPGHTEYKCLCSTSHTLALFEAARAAERASGVRRVALIGVMDLCCTVLETHRAGPPDCVASAFRKQVNTDIPLPSLTTTLAGALGEMVDGAGEWAACFTDVVNYLPRAAYYAAQSPRDYLAALRSRSKLDAAADHVKVLFAKLEYSLGLYDSLSESEAVELARSFFGAFTQSCDKEDSKAAATDRQPYDDYVLLAALVMLEQSMKLQEQDDPSLRQASVLHLLHTASITEGGVQRRPQNAELRVLHLRVLAHLGRPEPAFAGMLDIQLSQYDSLGYLLLHCLIRQGLWGNVRKLCTAITQFHRSYRHEGPSQLVQIFSSGEFGKLKETLTVSDRWANSITKLEADLECLAQIVLAEQSSAAEFRDFITSIDSILAETFQHAEGTATVNNEDTSILDLFLFRPNGAAADRLRAFLLPEECSDPIDNRLSHTRVLLSCILTLRALHSADMSHHAALKQQQQQQQQQGKKVATVKEQPVEEPDADKPPVFRSASALAGYVGRSFTAYTVCDGAPTLPKFWPFAARPYAALQHLMIAALTLAETAANYTHGEVAADVNSAVCGHLAAALEGAKAARGAVGPLLEYLMVTMAGAPPDDAKLKDILQGAPLRSMERASPLAAVVRVTGFMTEVLNCITKWRILKALPAVRSALRAFVVEWARLLTISQSFTTEVLAEGKRQSQNRKEWGSLWGACRGLPELARAARAVSVAPEGAAHTVQALHAHTLARCGEAQGLLSEQCADFATRFPNLLQEPHRTA